MLLLLCVAATSAVAQGRGSALSDSIAAAQKAQARQDCRTAAEQYSVAVRLVPSSGELRSNLGVALYCDNQLPRAVAAFKKALALSPRLVAPHLFLGLAAYRTQDATTAANELGQSVRMQPADVTAHLWLGYTLVMQRKYEPALEQFKLASQLDPENLDAHYALGQCYLEIGRKKAQALQVLEPGGVHILQLAAEQYRMTGETVRAANAARAMAAGPNAAKDMRLDSRAAALYDDAHDAEARAQQAFQFVIQQAPDSYRAHQIMGDALVAMQQNDPAIVEYRTVLTLDPGLPGIHEAISNCLMQGGHFAGALAELLAEQTLQPQSARVLMELGRVQLAMDDESGAIASLQQALALKDPSPEILLLLGKATLHQGDAAGAIHYLLRYSAQDRNSSVAYYLLARAYRMTGDRAAMGQALESYQRAAHAAEQDRVVQQVTRDPLAMTTAMNAQEVQDAAMLLTAHP